MRRGRRSPGRTASRRSSASSATVGSGERLPVVPVILAGGEGTRLWPLAHAGQPKPFLPLFAGRSLFQITWNRVAPIAGAGRVLVVAGAAHLAWIRRQAPGLPRDRILVEDGGRNTAVSVALAALWARRRHGDALMVVVPADHWIEPAAAFRSAIARAVRCAAGHRSLVVLGVRPRGGHRGFGYIRAGAVRASSGCRPVVRFKEKPAAAEAARMARSGWTWNSGIFVWRASAILEELRALRPALLAPLERWAANARGAWTAPAAILRHLPALPIDRAVLERSRRLHVIPASFRWSDLGQWGALADHLPRGRAGLAALGRLATKDAPGCAAVNPGGLTVLIGVRDLVVVRSGGTVLVCRRDASEDVRAVAARMGAP